MAEDCLDHGLTGSKICSGSGQRMYLCDANYSASMHLHLPASPRVAWGQICVLKKGYAWLAQMSAMNASQLDAITDPPRRQQLEVED